MVYLVPACWLATRGLPLESRRHANYATVGDMIYDAEQLWLLRLYESCSYPVRSKAHSGRETRHHYSNATHVTVPSLFRPRGLTVSWWECYINQLNLPTPFYYLVSISVFMTLSTVFLSINSPDNSPFSHSLLPVLSLPYWSFQLYISLWKSPSALI